MTEKLLFKLPAPKRIGITLARLAALDRITLAIHDGRPLPRTVSGQILRRLIADGLVVAKIGRPATYHLTQVGRLVRTRSRYPGGRNEPSRVTAQAE